MRRTSYEIFVPVTGYTYQILGRCKNFLNKVKALLSPLDRYIKSLLFAAYIKASVYL